MNFSEYMALLSGNTDLLDKAKLEKKIASLGGSAVAGDSGQGVEEGGRAEATQVRTCRARQQDTVGACAAHARSRRKGE